MVADKFTRFKVAAEHSGVVAAVREQFGRYGEFHCDNADVLLWVSKLEECDVNLLAVTWLNETTFRFYSEPNTNGGDDFDHFDVGPMQLNVGNINRNIANQFLNVRDLNVKLALGTHSLLFNGDPLENLRLGARFLNRIGRAAIVGPSQTLLQRMLTVDEWIATPDADKLMRRAMAYTGPEARPKRRESWLKYGPMFDVFFKLYADV